MPRSPLPIPRRARPLLAGALVTTSLVATSLVASSLVASGAPAGPDVARDSHAQIAGRLRGLKEVSYMPAANGWSEMWTHWDPSGIDADLAKIAAMGATTVRVIVEPYAFDFPVPSAARRAEFAQFLALARAHGLTAQVTMFDLFGDYGSVDASRTFLRDLLGPYRDDPRISFVEVQNEIDPADPLAMQWLRSMIPFTEAVMGDIPVTVSTPGAMGVAGLTQLRAAVASTPPSFFDFHYYGSGGDAATTIAEAKAAAAPWPLYVGEAGDSTDDPRLDPNSESAQAGFYFSVETAAADLGLPCASAWTLNDFLARATPPDTSMTERYFGLYRVDGRAKPAVTVLRQSFDASRPGLAAATLYNPDFGTVANGMPTGWVEANPANATMTLSPVAHRGAYSVSIARTSGANDTQPAWTTTANLGEITTGQHVQATVWAEGADATGSSQIAVAWFGADNTYLGNATSRSLPAGTTHWTELGVDATAPAGATYAVISLQSYRNTGTVRFDDTHLTNLAHRPFPTLPTPPVTSGTGPVVRNPGFESVVDGMPTGWVEANPANATMTLSPVAHRGAYSVSIARTSGANDTQPAWTTTANLGEITTGQHVQATVWAEGADATGSSQIAVAWFGADNTYLGNATSRSLPAGTTHWTELGVDATAPAGATYAVISLQSYRNTGTVRFDDTHLTNLAHRPFPTLP